MNIKVYPLEQNKLAVISRPNIQMTQIDGGGFEIRWPVFYFYTWPGTFLFFFCLVMITRLTS